MQRFADDACDMDDGGVARLMAMAVVQHLEPVQVHENQRRIAAMPAAILDDIFQLRHHAAAVGKSRQAVVVRKHAQFGDFRPCRSEEHTSELQSLMRTSYAVFCLTKKNIQYINTKGDLINT